MASEVISHAIFASSHLTPARTALSSTPPPTPCFAPHLPQHLDPHSHPYPSAKSLLPPAHPFPIRVSLPSVFLSQTQPVDFLVRKKARFTHDMTFFYHDVREKRFNAHEGSHKMEMIISKDHVADKPWRWWDLWRHGRP